MADLSVREVYQLLKDIALGLRTLARVSPAPLAEAHTGLMAITTEGWAVILLKHSDTLIHCETCTAPPMAERARLRPGNATEQTP